MAQRWFISMLKGGNMNNGTYTGSEDETWSTSAQRRLTAFKIYTWKDAEIEE